MLAHNMARPRIRAYSRITSSLRRIDLIVVLSRSHEAYLRDELGVHPDRLRFIHDKVDHRFWRPGSAPGDGSVLSVGLSSRDYGTLLEAARGLTAPTVIVASSLWADGGLPQARSNPDVTLVGGISFRELRTRYERAAVVVVPLHGNELYAAGVNAVLEAMAMGKALVVTRTPGIADYVVDGETARVVPAGDPLTLRRVLRELLDDEAQRVRLGANARAVIESGRNLDGYLTSLTGAVREISMRR